MKKPYSVWTIILAGSLLLQLSAFFHLRSRRAGLWAALGLLAAQTFLPPTAHAAVTEAWVQRYSSLGGDSIDEASKILRDAAGDFLVVGATADLFAVQGLLIIKYSGADGSVVWQRRHDGPAAILMSFNPSSSVFAAVLDASGNLVMTTRADGANEYGDFYTAKYAAADGALLWERRYDGPAHGADIPSAVAVDSSGNVVVTGFSQIGLDDINSSYTYPTDYYTAKYAAADGALLWEKRYDGPLGGSDFARAVAVDSNGNVVVTGDSQSEIDVNGYFYDRDYYTAKYAAADGALLWERRYNGPATYYDDQPTALAVDASGNVVVTGASYGLGSYYDYYTVKYAGANGALLWEKRYDGPKHEIDVPTAVVVDSSGNVLVTGYSDGLGSYYDYYTAKYAAANGTLLWEKRYNGPATDYDLPTALAVDASGNVVVTGYSDGNSQYDYYTAKYAAANGALLWEKRYNGPTSGKDVAKGIAVDASGNVLVTGYSLSMDQNNSDFYTAKYAAVNGALLWDKRYNGPYNQNDYARAVAVDGAGNVVVTGSPATIKYLADGTMLWIKSQSASSLAVDGAGNVVVAGSSSTTKYLADGTMLWTRSQAASALAVDGAGNVVVTGYSFNGNDYDYYTAKYAAATGALLWEKRYNGPLNLDDNPQAVAVDGAGNVVVTGDSAGDYYTARYAAATGALLWEKRYNGPDDGDDVAQAVAVDASGNVAVTGRSNNGNEYDYYTAKYAAATGALLWEKRYNSTLNGGDDAAQGMAMDESGNVVVTGNSAGDYYTAKYAAADGALLWEKRYNGPANGIDDARAVAVDASGNVVVTGNSSGYYTAAYAAADGALLWEKRYNGPANGDDTVGGSHSLALGPNGMVAVTGASDGAFGPYFQAFDYATVVYRVLPSPPLVSIARSNAFVIVSWPVSSLSFQLQESTNFTLPNSWFAVAQSAITNAGQISVTVPATFGREFFRLKSQ